MFFVVIWIIFREYEYICDYSEVKVIDLDLKLGRMYRVVVKFCVIIICYVFLYSDGVLVLVNFFI